MHYCDSIDVCGGILKRPFRSMCAIVHSSGTATEAKADEGRVGGGGSMGRDHFNFKMNHFRYRMRYNCVDELLAVACISKLKSVHSKINKMS